MASDLILVEADGRCQFLVDTRHPSFPVDSEGWGRAGVANATGDGDFNSETTVSLSENDMKPFYYL